MYIKDEHYIHHDGPFFTATVLKTHATRPLSEDFNFFQVVHSHDKFSATVPITTIRGDKQLTHAGNAAFEGSMEVTVPLTTNGELGEETGLYVHKQHTASRNPGGAVMVRWAHVWVMVVLYWIVFMLYTSMGAVCAVHGVEYLSDSVPPSRLDLMCGIDEDRDESLRGHAPADGDRTLCSQPHDRHG